MCLAIPGTVSDIDGTEAVIDYDGVTKHASLQLVPDVKAGDIVLVHAGFVIKKLQKDDGEELCRLIAETMKAIE